MVNILRNGDRLQDMIYRFPYINIILSKKRKKKTRHTDRQTNYWNVEFDHWTKTDASKIKGWLRVEHICDCDSLSVNQ